MPAPIALAVPAAVAGLAYLNAKTHFSYDYRLLSAVFRALIQANRRQKSGRLNIFYVLEEQAQKYPDTILLIFEGRQWTYQEGYESVLKYGTWLKNTYNIKPKEIVAIDFENSEKFLFMWFGLWAIGAKPAFINYNLTGKALVHCLRISTARVALVDPRVSNNLTEDVRADLPQVDLVTFTPELEAAAMATKGIREPDEARAEKELKDLAMLIYTSGTTGLPKPAHVSWKKCFVGGLLVPRWMSFGRPDVFYTCMPLYHSSASILGFLITLTAGTTFSLGRKFSNKTFWPEVRASNATVIHYVGETCRYLLTAPPQIDPITGANLDLQNCVRIAFGNGLRPDIWNEFKNRFGISTIAEFYSATEGAGGSWNYSLNDFGKGAIGRIGNLTSLLFGRNTAVVELDHETDLPSRDPKTGLCIRMPAGEPGELLYGLDPANLSESYQGYFNNTTATNSKVIRDVIKKGDAWFRTGDLVRMDSEGRTYFHDRIGDTFRWKSENVSTNEVSEALGRHPAVHEANVYGVELPNHDGRAGCVTISLAEKPNPRLMQDLAAHALGSLPRYAVPLFLRMPVEEVEGQEANKTGTNKQQKHILRAQGADPSKAGRDALYWLQGQEYVPFGKREWEELRVGRVKL